MKTVFVTGAAQGIGQAIAARFSRDAWRVVLIDRNREAVEAAAAELAAAGGSVRAATLDVCDEAAVRACIAAEPRVDAVVTAAGVYSDREFFDLTADDFRKMHEVNVIGTFSSRRKARAACSAAAAS